MFGHIILTAVFLHLSYFIYLCIICRGCVLTSGPIPPCRGQPLLLHALAPMDIKPRNSSQSETTMYLKSFYSMEAEDADNTQERDALYRWPWVRSDAARESKGSVKWFHMELPLQWSLLPCQQSQGPSGCEPRTLSVGVFPGELWQLCISELKERETITQQGMRRPL